MHRPISERTATPSETPDPAKDGWLFTFGKFPSAVTLARLLAVPERRRKARKVLAFYQMYSTSLRVLAEAKRPGVKWSQEMILKLYLDDRLRAMEELVEDDVELKEFALCVLRAKHADAIRLVRGSPPWKAR